MSEQTCSEKYMKSRLAFHLSAKGIWEDEWKAVGARDWWG